MKESDVMKRCRIFCAIKSKTHFAVNDIHILSFVVVLTDVKQNVSEIITPGADI